MENQELEEAQINKVPEQEAQAIEKPRRSGFTIEKEDLIAKRRVTPFKRLGAFLIDVAIAFFMMHLVTTIMGVGLVKLENATSEFRDFNDKQKESIENFNSQAGVLEQELNGKKDKLSRANAETAGSLQIEVNSIQTEIQSFKTKIEAITKDTKLKSATLAFEIRKIMNIIAVNFLFFLLIVLYFDVAKGRSLGKYFLKFEFRTAYGDKPSQKSLFKRFLIKNFFTILGLIAGILMLVSNDTTFKVQSIFIFYAIYGFISLLGNRNQGIIDRKLNIGMYPRKFSNAGIGEEK